MMDRTPMFCFRAVEIRNRIRQNVWEPCLLRNVPEIFCLIFAIRLSRSTWLLSDGTRRSVRKASSHFDIVLDDLTAFSLYPALDVLLFLEEKWDGGGSLLVLARSDENTSASILLSYRMKAQMSALSHVWPCVKNRSYLSPRFACVDPKSRSVPAIGGHDKTHDRIGRTESTVKTRHEQRFL